MELLIERGAYVNARSHLYGTPLCLAVIRGSVDVANFLLKDHRANVNADGGLLGSALHAACYVGGREALTSPLRITLLELCLSFGAHVSSR